MKDFVRKRRRKLPANHHCRKKGQRKLARFHKSKDHLLNLRCLEGQNPGERWTG
ncbi:hypothetical protein HOLleu_08790 [Holothuria leucospilota]|uniref:Uncharacterized protein n=1 Tax=Holothuria leucospilota TaxID=206669 RepID=A0A9Q1CI25_HOLLE|nr:hypothetical protein HOLleu_08790 [Holothuria leucospilota]